MNIRQLHPHFVGEVTGIDLSATQSAPVIDSIHDALGQYGVLVFRDQSVDRDKVLERFGLSLGSLDSFEHYDNSIRPSPHIARVTNLDDAGNILAPDSLKIQRNKANALWHVDNSYRQIPASYSMLAAHILPPEGGNTEFCDTRAAYDALPEATKKRLEGLIGKHSIVYSRELTGFTQWTPEQRAKLGWASHPLVRTHPRSGRKALYIASHLGEVVGLPVEEGRALVKELMAFATRPEFIYAHVWRAGDFVVYDNRSVMHRATSFESEKYRRELLTARVLDVDLQGA